MSCKTTICILPSCFLQEIICIALMFCHPRGSRFPDLKMSVTLDNESKVRMVITKLAIINPFLSLFGCKSVPNSVLSLEKEVQDDD